MQTKQQVVVKISFPFVALKRALLFACRAVLQEPVLYIIKLKVLF